MSIPYAMVIVNPVAGAYSTRRKWSRISRLLKHIGLSFDYKYTEGVGHAIELAKEAAIDGYQYVVAVGGDGTAHEVANGILCSTGAGNTSLSIISTGTGSDFARSVGISRNYCSACSSLAGQRKLLIDVGVVEYQSKGQSLQRFLPIRNKNLPVSVNQKQPNQILQHTNTERLNRNNSGKTSH